MKVIVTAGGTGGHIYPALAIIEKLKTLVADLDILYIGTTDRMEAEIIPKKGIKYLGVETKGLNRKNPFKNFAVLKTYLRAKRLLKKEIKNFNPDIVIGVGGYISLPVCQVASSLGIKVFIHEQNAIPGLANKLIAKKADLIGVSLEDSLNYFPQEKTVFTGNPCSERVYLAKALSKEDLGLDPKAKLVLIVMGSLGSLTINEMMKKILQDFRDKAYQVVFVSGKNYYEDYEKIDFPPNVHIYPYLDDMPSFLKNTDLIISRAGATTLAEITVLGIPSILIPSPHVTHNHQEENAAVLEKAGASLVIKEKDLETNLLLSKIDEVLSSKYDIMAKNSKKLGIVDSASKIAKLILDLTGDTDE